MHRLGFGLALLVSLISHDAFATNRHIRTSLDDEPKAPEVHAPAQSHADFPLVAERVPVVVQGRLIRLTLDDDGEVYGRLTKDHSPGRRLRASLD